MDGTGAAARFSSPCGIAGDGAGNLFVADGRQQRQHRPEDRHRDRRRHHDRGRGRHGRGSRRRDRRRRPFQPPVGIASDGAGNLYVADIGNNTIRKVVVATGAVTTFAGAAGQSAHVDGAGAAARFASPKGIASDGAGNLYVADSEPTPSGRSSSRPAPSPRSRVASTAAPTGSAPPRVSQPSGIAADGAGNLFVTDTGNHTIRKVVIATGGRHHVRGRGRRPVRQHADGTARRPISTCPWASPPTAAGNLYVADGNSIRKIVIATRAVTTFAGTADQMGSADGTGTAARFNSPVGIATRRGGQPLRRRHRQQHHPEDRHRDPRRHHVRGRGRRAGGVDGTGAVARFTGPNAIASDGGGNLYIGDGNGTVRKIAIDSATVSTVIGSPGRMGVSLGALPAALNAPYGIVVLPTGDLAIVDTIEDSILIGRLK